MHDEVKKCAERNDIKGLRYIFVDALDVDPTFDKYREDYEYCKQKTDIFDSHREISPLISNRSQWTLQYWEQLKLDLMKNFSEKRFEHMISVARVVYAEKISRLEQERQKKEQEESRKNAVGQKSRSPEPVVDTVRMKEMQDQRIAEAQKKLEEENKRIEAEQAEQRARIAAAQKNDTRSDIQYGRSMQKKALGIVLVGVLLIAIIFIMVILH